MSKYDEPMTARIPVVRVEEEPKTPLPPAPAPLLPEVPIHNHPKPQRQLDPPKQQTVGDTTFIETGEGYFEEIDPFSFPPGTNLLPTVYTNAFDSFGNEIPNTLPSSPLNPNNLHQGAPKKKDINITSPTNDLSHIFDRLANLLSGKSASEFWSRHGGRAQPEEVGRTIPAEEADLDSIRQQLSRAIHILEGNPIPDREYSGFPLLHYNGPDKIKKVEPIRDKRGKIIGGNVNIHQLWYDHHIESDTAFLDLSPLDGPDGKPLDVTFTITYKLTVLDKGKDAFSPFMMLNDHPDFPPGKGFGEPAVPGVAFDQSFEPIGEGQQIDIVIKMPPPKYYKFIYTWGWRFHPPRVQALENARTLFPETAEPGGPKQKTLPQYEEEVFGGGKSRSEAIAMLSDLAPEKRMWTFFRKALVSINADKPDTNKALVDVCQARAAFFDWKDRTTLPAGAEVDPDTDMTLLYAGNTIYGEHRDGSFVDFEKWRTRGTNFKVTLLNADYFQRAYASLDFGGGRGWENQWKPGLREGQQGPYFSFGRAWWSQNTDVRQPIILPAATKDRKGRSFPVKRKVQIKFNFEPSRRLRLYQYDPMHHDVGVFSVH
ncbi:hypothetical protein [Stackebrandtia nassauensis]|uniref:Uncharacterized protein n=1 Tax=Stackebrandtia nassauensis (strain DSM 44728 / CIP 108903 / NRRL B-16338 / NBRC 102104 / LLR-40K-21) TaxID=446470 RepID=D3Q474_STANL|nr:hypothetical protein [Stackebrandtia nassauensis]ADD45959.1 hypothetical protein Snas_6342 [Stackebrandtia nassauensis DSM 44728]